MDVVDAGSVVMVAVDVFSPELSAYRLVPFLTQSARTTMSAAVRFRMVIGEVFPGGSVGVVAAVVVLVVVARSADCDFEDPFRPPSTSTTTAIRVAPMPMR